MVTWEPQRSDGHSLGRRHDGGGVEAHMSMACVPGFRRNVHINLRSSRITVVDGCYPLRVKIQAFVMWSYHQTPTKITFIEH